MVEGESGWVWTLDSSGGTTDINHRYDMGGNASVVQFNLGYVQLYRPDSFCAATNIISDSATVQYSTVQYSTVHFNPPRNNHGTTELHWRLHGQPMQQNHSYLAKTSLIAHTRTVISARFL